VAKKKTKPKPEQLKIAGTERPDRIESLDDLAEQYRNIRDQRMGLQSEESDLQGQLQAAMEEHGLERYVYEDKAGDLEEVTVKETDIKVSVRKLKKPREEAASTSAASN